MRIQSKFHDYYDGQQKYNSDYKKVFNRCTSIDEIEPLKEYCGYELRSVRIGFCGTIYNMLYRAEYKPTGYTPTDAYYQYNYRSEEFIYSIDDYIAMHAKCKYSGRVTLEEKRKTGTYLQSWKDDTIFVKYNCPVFIQTGSNSYMNGSNGTIWAHTLTRPFVAESRRYDYNNTPNKTLAQYKFDKIISAEQAYMEIESYISGVLGREHKVIPEMDNATKVAIHGFNKTSFCRKKNDKV